MRFAPVRALSLCCGQDINLSYRNERRQQWRRGTKEQYERRVSQ